MCSCLLLVRTSVNVDRAFCEWFSSVLLGPARTIHISSGSPPLEFDHQRCRAMVSSHHNRDPAHRAPHIPMGTFVLFLFSTHTKSCHRFHRRCAIWCFFRCNDLLLQTLLSCAPVPAYALSLPCQHLELALPSHLLGLETRPTSRRQHLVSHSKSPNQMMAPTTVSPLLTTAATTSCAFVWETSDAATMQAQVLLKMSTTLQREWRAIWTRSSGSDSFDRLGCHSIQVRVFFDNICSCVCLCVYVFFHCLNHALVHRRLADKHAVHAGGGGCVGVD
jgi:hypothetical protein